MKTVRPGVLADTERTKGRAVRDLVVTENITLDGVIDASEDWFQPTGSEDPDATAELAQAQSEHMAAADAVLLGRVTFEEFRGFWPNQTDDQTGISEYLDNTMKYVASSTLTDPAWQNTTVLRGPLADEVAALKAQPGKAIVATGSVQLVHGLVPTGLVDEYRLFVYPVVVGRGRRLFPDRTARSGLRLIETRPFRSGIVLLRYRATGPALPH